MQVETKGGKSMLEPTPSSHLTTPHTAARAVISTFREKLLLPQEKQLEVIYQELRFTRRLLYFLLGLNIASFIVSVYLLVT